MYAIHSFCRLCRHSEVVSDTAIRIPMSLLALVHNKVLAFLLHFAAFGKHKESAHETVSIEHDSNLGDACHNPLRAQRPTVIVDETTSPFEAASVR